MSLKAKLMQAPWPKYADAMVAIEGEEVPIILRRPPMGVLVKELERAREAGEVDKQNMPVDQLGATRMIARFARLTIFEPGATAPLFSDDEREALVDAPWLMSLHEPITLCISAVKTGLEGAKGN